MLSRIEAAWVDLVILGIKVSIQSDPVSPGGVNPAVGCESFQKNWPTPCVDAVTVAQIWIEVAGNQSDGGKDCLDSLHREFIRCSSHVCTGDFFPFSLSKKLHTPT